MESEKKGALLGTVGTQFRREMPPSVCWACLAFDAVHRTKVREFTVVETFSQKGKDDASIQNLYRSKILF